MNARTIAQIVSVVGISSMLVGGCAVAPAGGEDTGEGSSALEQCTNTNLLGSCPTNGTLSNTSPIEADLIALGCSTTRVVTKGTVAGGDAMYEVLCPTTTYLTYRTTVILNTKPVVITYHETAVQLAAANAGAPYYMSSSNDSECPYCAPVAPSGSVYIDYDPICGASGSGNCAIKNSGAAQ